MEMLKHIYLDMDGVLADFDLAFRKLSGYLPSEYEAKHGSFRFWEKVYSSPNFFLDLPEFSHNFHLLRLCKSCAPVTILSSPSKTNTTLCILQKREWLDRHLGNHFPAIFEREKHLFASPHRLLIDDTESKIKAWEEAGGVGHLFTDFASCQAFLELYVPAKCVLIENSP